MTFPANVHSGNVAAHDSASSTGSDPVVIQHGDSARHGYTSEAAWSADSLRGTRVSPPILFEGCSEAESLTLSEIRVFFVRSFQTEDHAEPIHFHDNMPHAELLWVRLVLENGEQMEGMMRNSESVVLDELLVLIPTDPQTNNRKILFPRRQVREFHVLGVRPA